MNIELLTKIKERILAEPEHFMMEDYHSACGTMHCIAGWALVLSGCVTGEKLEWNVAQSVLGLSVAQSTSLFIGCSWPNKFQKRWVESTSNAERARIAAERIDHMIETGR